MKIWLITWHNDNDFIFSSPSGEWSCFTFLEMDNFPGYECVFFMSKEECEKELEARFPGDHYWIPYELDFGHHGA